MVFEIQEMQIKHGGGRGATAVVALPASAQ